MSTIAAISTPHAVGGLSVIRMSGEDAIAIVAKLFRPFQGEEVAKMPGYTCAYGRVMDGEAVLDDAVLTVFRAPKSYTGEDTAELSCHGGLYLSQAVLRLMLQNGAVLAAPGEFTKRAFLAGKLSLTQAEAVMDLIAAKGETELRYAVALREGAMARRIHACSDRIVQLLGDLAVWADYPDEDIPEVSEDALSAALEALSAELSEIARTYDYGRILREGVDTVIAGRPNVGKSTLMNSLTGFARSIVTDIAGTTRDVIDGDREVGDLTLRLSDTAGLRETPDQIEKMGVDIALKRLDAADLILAVFDSTEPLKPEDFSLTERLRGRRVIAILNKTDADPKIDKQYLYDSYEHVVELSAKDGAGLDALERTLNALFLADEPDVQAGLVANERQKHCLTVAISQVDAALGAIRAGELLDAVTVLLDEAANTLLELTGERASEAVVDSVFSRFCVGK